MAERDAELSPEELIKKYPEGSDDPAVVAKLRSAREKLRAGLPEKKYYIDAHGAVTPLTEAEYNRLPPEEKQRICVGDTCFHYNQDVDLGRKNS